MLPTGRNISAITRPTARATCLFHLDPLWTDDNVDFVGIDNYMPLSDWRDGEEHADAGWGSYLQPRLSGGECRRWRGLRLVLPCARGARGAVAHADRGHRLWRGLGVPLQGSASAGGRTRIIDRPGGVRAGGRYRLGAGDEADLVHRAGLPGGGQGHQPAERVPRSEIVGIGVALSLQRPARRRDPDAVSARGACLVERGGA